MDDTHCATLGGDEGTIRFYEEIKREKEDVDSEAASGSRGKWDAVVREFRV